MLRNCEASRGGCLLNTNPEFPLCSQSSSELQLSSPIPFVPQWCVGKTFETYSGLEFCASQSLQPLLQLQHLGGVFKQERRFLVNGRALAAEVSLPSYRVSFSQTGGEGEYGKNMISRESFRHLTVTTHSAILLSSVLPIPRSHRRVPGVVSKPTFHFAWLTPRNTPSFQSSQGV